jgi:metal-dependent amidase/aminoacylase/carboxypeptidase family protein
MVARPGCYPCPMDWTKINEDIAALDDELVEIRRDLHKHPELGFEEHRT